MPTNHANESNESCRRIMPGIAICISAHCATSNTPTGRFATDSPNAFTLRAHAGRVLATERNHAEGITPGIAMCISVHSTTSSQSTLPAQDT